VESKILNFPEAMRVAQIVTKYMPDTESIKTMTGEDFYAVLFSQMQETEMLEVFGLLEVSLDTGTSQKLLEVCVEILIKNNILDLLDTYKNLGFTH
jgi:hypothetical protein